ncbi:MAG: tetraacyldisaccharide 4'-kinase [Gammaproteobacteria bacterium]
MPTLQRLWTRTGFVTLLLAPFALLFALVVGLRRLAYRRGWRPSVAVGVPVVVVGNITVGGSGKTPLVIWLVERLRAQGWRPGVVSRGYGGSARGCVEVMPDSEPALTGDEPLLIRIKADVPVVVGRDRVAAARWLLAHHPGVDVIVSDDGLQHYRLARDVEIAVVDAAVGLGNRWPLPAGPLREPPGRLREVDAVVQVLRGTAVPRRDLGPKAWHVDYRPGRAWRLQAPSARLALADLPPRDWVAATGIGRPQGFFDMLRAQGLAVETRAFPDHHAFRPGELPIEGAVLMTEKDAVKCRPFAGTDWWAVELDVAPEKGFMDWLDARLATIPIHTRGRMEGGVG